MKKMSLAALLLAIVMLMSSCGGTGANPSAPADTTPGNTAPVDPAQPDTPAMEPKTLTFATQSVGSGSYVRVAAYCEVINKYLPEGWSVETSPISSGAQASTMLVEQGTCDIGSGVNITNKLLVEGKFEGVDTLHNTLAVWGGTDFSYLTIIFSDSFQKKTGYTTLEELIASGTPFNVSTKAPGSSGMQAAEDLLACLGSSFEDIEKLGGTCYHIDPTQMCDLLKEGKADVIIDCPSLGQPAIAELAMTSTLYFPALSDETLAKMEERGYPTMVMPANSWTGQTEDTKTATNCDSIVVRADLPNEIAYAIAKAVCEGRDEIVELVPTCAPFDPTIAGTDLINGLKLHPGAEQYYKEVGYLK